MFFNKLDIQSVHTQNAKTCVHICMSHFGGVLSFVLSCIRIIYIFVFTHDV